MIKAVSNIQHSSFFLSNKKALKKVTLVAGLVSACVFGGGIMSLSFNSTFAYVVIGGSASAAAVSLIAIVFLSWHCSHSSYVQLEKKNHEKEDYLEVFRKKIIRGERLSFDGSSSESAKERTGELPIEMWVKILENLESNDLIKMSTLSWGFNRMVYDKRGPIKKVIVKMENLKKKREELFKKMPPLLQEIFPQPEKLQILDACDENWYTFALRLINNKASDQPSDNPILGATTLTDLIFAIRFHFQSTPSILNQTREGVFILSCTNRKEEKWTVWQFSMPQNRGKKETCVELDAEYVSWLKQLLVGKSCEKWGRIYTLWKPESEI